MKTSDFLIICLCLVDDFIMPDVIVFCIILKIVGLVLVLNYNI